MTATPPSAAPRFPWVYAVAALVPLALLGGVFLAPILFGEDAMVFAMACPFLSGLTAVPVVGWGVVRLLTGKGREHPALPGLVLLPALVGGMAVVAG